MNPKPAKKVVHKPVQETTPEAPLGEFAAAAADISKALSVTPPLDAKLSEEALSKEIKALVPEIKEGDDLCLATWKTLKKLGWGAKKLKVPAKPVNDVSKPKAEKPKAEKPKGEKKVSQSATITAAVGQKTSVSCADLVKKTGLNPQRIRSHLSWMKRNNLWNGTIKD